MSEKTIHIDPEKFAYNFINTLDFKTFDKSTVQENVKSELFAYLSAYTLAEKFNVSEASTFLSNEQKEIENLSMGEFLKLVSQKSGFTPDV